MRYLQSNDQECKEFRKEALRLVKEVAVDEVELKEEYKNSKIYKTQAIIDQSLTMVDVLNNQIDRKIRLIDTLIRG